MLTPEQEHRLDCLSREFRAALRHRLPDLKYDEAFTDRLIVTISAQHPETGAITVYLDGDEVTVGVGEHFHTHFEAYFTEQADLTQTELERRAAARAAAFIADFMADEIVLRISREGRVAGTFHRAIKKEPPGPDEMDYLWSGPKRSRP
jgi:hypothetical protein